jgi:hypothetical protein
MSPADEAVRLTVVATEVEAAELCGYLETEGIRAVYDKGGIAGLGNMWLGPGMGRQQILVNASDLEAAQQALAALEEKA